MTSLIAWSPVDQRYPSAIYLASDSRITWGSPELYWDNARKLFSSKTSPDIFGYVGDVIFPIMTLGQLVEMIEQGLLFTKDDSFPIKCEKVNSFIKNSLASYPSKQFNPFDILYISRTAKGMESKFNAVKIVAKKNCELESTELDHLTNDDGTICHLGTGADSTKKHINSWHEQMGKKTSRAVFGGFCDSIKSSDDKYSGGAPQLAGLYRKGNAKTFGIIFDGKAYFSGQPVNEEIRTEIIEWRNELFERCDVSGDLVDKAQRQPSPFPKQL